LFKDVEKVKTLNEIKMEIEKVKT